MLDGDQKHDFVRTFALRHDDRSYEVDTKKAIKTLFIIQFLKATLPYFTEETIQINNIGKIENINAFDSLIKPFVNDELEYLLKNEKPSTPFLKNFLPSR